MRRVEFSSIQQQLTELASGGEGVVHNIGGQPLLVFKEYKRVVLPKLNVTALEGLASLESRIPAADWALISSRTSWPHTLVYDGNQPVGFLMDRVPDTFWKSYGLARSPRTVLCEWNYLIHRGQPANANMVSDIPQVENKVIVSLVHDLAKTVQALHRSGVVIGDMSGKNLIWDVNPLRVLIIDCDSFRIDGAPATTDTKQSPDWIDPTVGNGQTSMSSDIYKLGIAAYRALWRVTSGDPVASTIRANPPQGVPSALVELIATSIEPTGRPSADDWVSTLDQAFRYGGRPVVRAGQARDSSAPIVRPTLATAIDDADEIGEIEETGDGLAVPPPPVLPSPPRATRPRLPMQ